MDITRYKKSLAAGTVRITTTPDGLFFADYTTFDRDTGETHLDRQALDLNAINAQILDYQQDIQLLSSLAQQITVVPK